MIRRGVLRLQRSASLPIPKVLATAGHIHRHLEVVILEFAFNSIELLQAILQDTT
jgi:hypothetical protein